MILLITLVILVILSTLGYTLSVRVAARRHRDQYLIDCCVARNACVSGVKYALASMDNLDFALVSRPNEPDFSDVFALTEPEYQKLLAQMERYLAESRLADPNVGEKPVKETASGNKNRSADTNEAGTDAPGLSAGGQKVEIPGPYGSRWPLVTEPVKFEIGTAKVTIEIEDENAKYPLGWVLLADDKQREAAGVGWTTFCEWMGYSSEEIADLNRDLAAIAKAKRFKTEFKEEKTDVPVEADPRARPTRSTPKATSAAAARRTTGKKTVTVAEQIQQQNTEFATLFHSSLLNTALLSRPSIASDSRQESAMKYLGLWSTRHVNINTAPRNVLEAAVSFGSVMHAPKIAETIIQQRKIKPVEDVNEIKQAMLGYSDSIEKCRDYLTTVSTVFTIRVTAVSGAAQATAVAAVGKEGDKIKQIAVICD